jgi:magnesium chelatase subunit D
VGSNGKYIRSEIPKGKPRDIALDATIRAAAPYQNQRENNGMAIVIKSQDIREKIRVGKVSTACIFVVDASGSMGAMKRMESAKGAVLSLLMESYQQRDRIGMVAFRGDRADVLLPLCSSVDLAVERLKELPTGGRTPLSAGLEKGLHLLIAEKKKNSETIPTLVLISDGHANVSMGGKIKEELKEIASLAKDNGIHLIVIDTENVNKSFINMQVGYCRDIANYVDGRWYPITDLSSQKICDIIFHEQDSRFG